MRYLSCAFLLSFAAVALTSAATAPDGLEASRAAMALPILEGVPVSAMTAKACGAGELKVAAAPDLGARMMISTTTDTRPSKARAKSIGSTSEIAGDYVMSYDAHSSVTNSWGCGITITAIEGTDSIVMEGFWEEGHTVKARVDIDSMTLAIPCQVIGTNSTYGDYDIARSDSMGTPDRASDIEGVINADGTISITSWWGVFVATGVYKDNYYALNSSTELEKANASMTFQTYDSGTITDHKFNVVVTQSGSRVNVKNFANIGIDIEIKLKSDSTSSIVTQYAYTVGYYDSDAYLYAFYYYSDYSGVYYYSDKIDCHKATDTRTISWDGWNFLYTYDGTSYWTGVYYISGNIETSFDLTYPDPYQTIFDGDGTADSPYLIGTPAEWNDLAEYMAETETDLTDKYVKLTADLDFSGVDIKPLSYDQITGFNGDLDGDGKTIKGFNIETGSTYYAPIVTTALTDSRIHDLTVEGAALVRHSYCGAVVGYLYGGTVSNVTSNVELTFDNIDASTAPYSMGGVVGCCKLATITDCSFGGTITYTPLYSGGISGYTEQTAVKGCVNRGAVTGATTSFGGISGYAYYYSTITDCHNYGTLSDIGPYSGGVVGLGYGATVKDCSNRGPITTSSKYCGGVAGWIMYDTVLVDCSNDAPVKFTGDYCGGVVGYVAYAKAVNCVNNDTVTLDGQYSGGIAGYVYYDDGELDGCVNRGVVNLSASYSGGVAGYIYDDVAVTGCANEGVVDAASSYCGGVVGKAENATITSCANRGQVSLDGDYSGGVAGAATQCVITGCYNDSVVECTRSYCGGVIGYTDTDTISNCGNNGTATFTGSMSAGVVGSLSGSLMSSCYNNGSVTSTGRYCAGVAGRCYQSSLTDCHNTGSVTTTDRYTGGVIGQCAASTEATMCANSGSVTSSGIYLGGVVGNTSADGTTLLSCHNLGTVTYTGSAAACYAAGIIGYSSVGDIISCYNSGAVQATSTSSGYLAGIIGYCGTASATTDQYNIKSCYNSADITGYYCVAGLIAYTRSTAPLGLTSCRNTGDITATATTSSSAASAGLVGYFSPGSTFTSCYNTGDITTAGTSHTAGLFGNPVTDPTASAPISATGCYNAGNVISAGNVTGGIFGYMPLYTTADKCFNVGDIASTGDEVGGIAGRAASTLTNVYNCGDISGAESVGGIAGATDTGTSIATGYSTGKILAAGTCGNIIGTSDGDVSEVYYLTANDAGGVTAGTGLSYAELAILELDGWVSGDSCTYPILQSNDYSKAHAAAVIPADGDSYSSISTDLRVGAPDGVTWTASPDALKFSGNAAAFTQTYTGQLTLTATCGDVSVVTELNCVNAIGGVGGVAGVAGGDRAIVAERYYTASGSPVAKPAGGPKAIYIVVRTYDDGTSQTVKEIR